jgi:hypothetical protein
MSYGVWDKRGKGWSSIEIDGAGSTEYQWEILGEEKAKKMRSDARKLCINTCGSYAGDDFNFLRWAINQRKKGWRIYSVDTQSDHCLWIALEDDRFLVSAKGVLGHKLEGKELVLAAPVYFSWSE